MPIPPFPTISSATIKARWTANAGVPSSGSSVTTWSDQSGNGKHLTAGTAPTFYSQRWAQGRADIEFNSPNNLTVAGSGAYFAFTCDGSANAAFIVWRDRDLAPGTIGTLMDTGGYTTTTHGLRISFDDSTVTAGLRLDVANGSSQIVSHAIANAVPYRQCHCSTITFDGTTYTFYEWGGLLGTVGAGVGYSGTGALALMVGENAAGAGNPFNGDIAEIIIVSGTLSAADLAAIHAYLECVWHPAGNQTSEYYVDGATTGQSGQTNVISASGAGFSVILPTKFSGNPILTNATYDLTEGQVIQFGANDWGFYAELINVNDSSQHTGYFSSSSSDGRSGWSGPTLLLTGLTNPALDNFAYNPNGVAGQQYLLSFSYTPLNISHSCAISSGSTRTGQSLLKDFGAGFNPDAGALMQRADGRWANIGEDETHDNTAPFRVTSMVISNTSDLSGTWGSVQSQIVVGTANNQYYAPYVQPLGNNWLNLCSIYNPSGQGGDDKVHIDLLHSRDEGWSYIVCKTNYIPNGTTGQWDAGTIFSANFDPTFTTCFYFGGVGTHTQFPRDSALGYASGNTMRLAGASGTQQIISRAMYQPGQVFNLNCEAGAGTITIALLDPSNNVITGYADTDSTVVTGSHPETSKAQVLWDGNPMPARIVRPRITLTGVPA